MLAYPQSSSSSSSSSSSAYYFPYFWGTGLPYGLNIRRTGHKPPRGPNAISPKESRKFTSNAQFIKIAEWTDGEPISDSL
jgi:hypothetical protein